MSRSVIAILFISSFTLAGQQVFEVDGKVKVADMDIKNAADYVVGVEDDGTLVRRAATSLIEKEYEIGEFAHGGIVFWVDETGMHGLVCAISDQSSGIRWHAGTDGNTQAKGEGPGAGKSNTAIIISAQVSIGDDGALYAARICNELHTTDIFNRGVNYNYGDWYLPAKGELSLMFVNRVAIDETAVQLSSFGGESIVNAFYWSSTEFNSKEAEVINFGISALGISLDKFRDDFRVRAIRSF